MSNLRQNTKPDRKITDYEWDVTPHSVKAIIDRLQQLLLEERKKRENLSLENQWLREQLDLKLESYSGVTKPNIPEVILWAFVGLILTVGGTFIEAYSIPFSWLSGTPEFSPQTLGVSCQIGAVLLTGCLGGATSAFLSQISYIGLGLMGLPLFDRGGGLDYILEPSFGYLLGFVFGAWLCGYFAFKDVATLDRLIFSCSAGLFIIHCTGIIYLVFLYFFDRLGDNIDSLIYNIRLYSWLPLLGQIAVICGVIPLAYLMRKLILS